MELHLALSLLLVGGLSSADSEVLHVTSKEGNVAILHCGELTTGTVTWSRDINGQRVDILTTHNGETTKHASDPRYGSGANLALTIFRVSQLDAGRYHCNGSTVELSVGSRIPPVIPATPRPGDFPAAKETDVVAVIRTVLILGGAILAVLFFLLVTVAAGRVILHQAKQTDRTARRDPALGRPCRATVYENA